MAATAGAKNSLHCEHCGRAVSETVHTRASYRVDYYALHTGEVEPMTVASGDDTVPALTVFKLVRPADVVTCVQCYRRPEVRVARERLFRPEAASPA